MKRKLPEFENEDQEREFWATHDASEELDWSAAEAVVLPKLRPTLKTISLRLPASLLAELKMLANERDVPYQSLLKIFLAERIKQEISGRRLKPASA